MQFYNNIRHFVAGDGWETRGSSSFLFSTKKESFGKEKSLFLAFICFLPIIILRDFTPGNELRYLCIVDDAIANGNFFCFHFNGAIYADKPPLYFWFLMLGKWIFGEHQMWFLSLFSIIPAFVVLRVMERWTGINKPYVLLTTVLFLVSALVLRMDMLMTMFIVLALKKFWDLYTTGVTTKNSIIFGLYVFFAVFSKGPYGILIPLISTLAFCVINKNLRLFFQAWNWKVWLTILLLFALWMLAVYLEGGQEYINNLLFHQTLDRGVKSFKHNEPFYYYLYTTLYDLLPWTPLVIYVAWKAFKERIKLDEKEKYFLTIIVTTFVMLSLISSKTEVYMLPIYPFIVFLTTRLYALLIQDEYCRDHWNFAQVIGWFVLAITLIAGLAMPLINPYIGFRDLARECVRLNNIYHYDKFYGLELHRCQGMTYYDQSLDVELVLAYDSVEPDYSHSIVIVDPRAKKRQLAIPTTAIDSSKIGNYVIYVVPDK